MEIFKLQHEVWKIAEEKGWHEGEPISFGEFISLCHTELSEAFEIYRERGVCGITYVKLSETLEHTTRGEVDMELPISGPEGIPIELADVIMRIFDYCETKGINLQKALEAKMEYNKTREHRHGGKFL